MFLLVALICWPPFERLGPGVDALAGAAVVPRPATDQTATGAVHALFGVRIPHDDEVPIGGAYEARHIACRRVILIFDADAASDLPNSFLVRAYIAQASPAKASRTTIQIRGDITCRETR
jgi:hypothetical protein